MYRHCDVCKQIDEGPRHCFINEPDQYPVDEALILAVIEHPDAPALDKANMIADIRNTGDQTRHFACCAAAGCPSLGQGDADCNTKVGG